MVAILRKVTKDTRALGVGVSVFLFVLTVVVVLPNAKLLALVWFDDAVTLATKGGLLISLYGSLLSNQTWVSGSIALITAFLAGLNAALLTLYIRTTGKGVKVTHISAASVGGIVAGLFGIGCAGCGSIILTSVLATAGATAILSLPFDGVEIGIVGIVLLVYATKKLVAEIKKGNVCNVS